MMFIYYIDLICLLIATIIVIGMVIKRYFNSHKETKEYQMHVWIGVAFVYTMIMVHLTDVFNGIDALQKSLKTNDYMIWQYVGSIVVLILFIIHFIKRLNK